MLRPTKLLGKYLTENKVFVEPKNVGPTRNAKIQHCFKLPIVLSLCRDYSLEGISTALTESASEHITKRQITPLVKTIQFTVNHYTV